MVTAKQLAARAENLRWMPVGSKVTDLRGATWTKIGPDEWASPGERNIRSGTLAYGFEQR